MRWPWAVGSTPRRASGTAWPRCACGRAARGAGRARGDRVLPGGSSPTWSPRRPRSRSLISFYGSAVPDSLEVLTQISAPIQFHFGGSDPYIPRDQVARSRRPPGSRTRRSTWRKRRCTRSTTGRPRCSTTPSRGPGLAAGRGVPPPGPPGTQRRQLAGLPASRATMRRICSP